MKVKVAFVILFLCGAMAAQSGLEKQLFDQLNESREKAGRQPLQWDDRLAEAAREHSQEMVKKRTLTHVLPGEQGVAERIAKAGVHFNHSGENVGYNTDFEDVHSAFMHSPPHRENILNPDYDHVGIGMVQGSDGIFWATEDFAREVPNRTSDQAKELVAESFEFMRKKTGMPSLSRIQKPELHKLACEMARKGRLDPRAVLRLEGVRNAITYNSSRPEELPSSVQSAVSSRSLAKFSIGVCEMRTDSNPGGTYYIVMAFY
jgi:hypothetical protein